MPPSKVTEGWHLNWSSMLTNMRHRNMGRLINCLTEQKKVNLRKTLSKQQKIKVKMRKMKDAILYKSLIFKIIVHFDEKKLDKIKKIV